MVSKYKRLTLDEARAVAQAFFKANATANLPAEVLEEMSKGALETSGSISTDWEEVVGFIPDERGYYEFELYKPSPICPYVEKIYVRILVSRNRDDQMCLAMWMPDVEPYDGPYFT